MNTELLSVKTARAKLLFHKHSPEILLVGGIVSTLAGTVLACRATLKAPDLVNQAKSMMRAVDIIAENDPDNPENAPSEVKKAKVVLGLEYGLGLARLYAPAVILTTAGIGMLVGSNRILSRRNAALLGMYKAVDEAFKRYRGRVRDELGEEVDTYFRFKKKKEGLQILDAKKKPVKWDEIEADLPGELADTEDDRILGMPSQYAIFFDSSSPQWRTDNSFNEFFLKAQQNYANDKLQMAGHVFLNEVYDMLGVPRTKEGAIVGWVKEHGDDFIDFDIYNPYNAPYGEFETGPSTESLLLDFNVDGVIFDII